MERARSIGHVPIAQNEIVRERLRGFRVPAPQPEGEIDGSLIVPGSSLRAADATIGWVFSFDGSPQEVAVREEYPSTRIGYVQVAGVLVHLEELLKQEAAHLVDPEVIRLATQEALYSVAMPGSNVCRQDMPTVQFSWRAEIFEIFRDYRVEDASLLEILKLLVESTSDRRSPRGGVIISRCPNSECSSISLDVSFDGTSECPTCHVRVFPTDCLRVHEEVSEEHSNATSLGRLMSVLEHITMVGYLHFLSQRQPHVLGRVAFVMDGPLAVFGPPAWLHSAVQNYLQNLYTVLSERRQQLPVVVGVEKTGQFAEFAAAISARINRQHLMSLPDDFIFKHILTYRVSPGSAFGRDTYYGQKFFYKTSKGQLLTITVPKKRETTRDSFRPENYPTLPNTLALLDRIGTTLYEDAIIPVALAHSYASIPLRTGSRVLTLLARNHLGADSAGT